MSTLNNNNNNNNNTLTLFSITLALLAHAVITPLWYEQYTLVSLHHFHLFLHPIIGEHGAFCFPSLLLEYGMFNYFSLFILYHHIVASYTYIHTLTYIHAHIFYSNYFLVTGM